MSKGKAAVLIVQEHKQHGLAWIDEVSNAQKDGWCLRGAEAAAPTCKGERGKCGAAVAVRSSIGVANAKGLPYDCSPRGSRGRVGVVWTDGVVRGGLMVISVYLWHSEGMSDRNLAILHAAGEAARRFGGPFIVGGDFNMSPEQMESQRELLGKMGVKVMAPQGVSCGTTGGGSVIDYFLVDKRIAGAVVKVEVDHAFDASPHRAVVLRIKSSAPHHVLEVLDQARSFPARRPVTATKAPCEERPAELRALLSSVGEASEDKKRFSEDQQKDLDEMYSSILLEGERQLCDLFDCVNPDGGYDQRFLGRGAEVTTRMRRAVPKQAGQNGTAGLEVRGLQLLANRFRELAGVLKAEKRGETDPILRARRRKHFTDVQASLRRTRGDLSSFLGTTTGSSWSSKVDVAAAVDASSWQVGPVLMKWSLQARELAKEQAALEKSTGLKSWWRWVDDQLRAGASALHKLTKRAIVADPQPVDSTSGLSLDPQLMVQAEHGKWSKVWLKFQGVASAPWRTFRNWEKLTWAPELPPITTSMLREVAKSYKEFTGRGSEGIHPRWIGWLSDPLLELIADLLMMLEAGGYWPEQLEALVVLIPKADGGRRPVGLLPAIIRIWERCRRPVVQAWRATVSRDYNWAAKGRCPEDAVWKQALRGEVARAEGKETGSTLVDLVKAFEMVRLELVWQAGLRLHFPPLILRMVMEVFSLGRRLILDKAVAATIFTLSAILAGGSFATDALYVILVKTCDGILIEHPGTDLCLFVDDITLSVTGSAQYVAATLPIIFDEMVTQLEQDLHLVVSKGAKRWVLDPSTKTVTTASSRQLRDKLGPTFKAVGVPVVKATKMLGVDYCASGRGSRQHWKKRVKKVFARKEQFQRMGPAAARRLVRTGAAPAFRYGSGVFGVNPTGVKAIRSFSCQVQGKMDGRCSFARLSLTKYDPGAEVSLVPVQDWARAVWDGWVTREELQKAWKMAMSTVAVADRPFAAVIGPAGAYVASAIRAGWKLPSAFHVLSIDGTLICLDDVSPKIVMKHAVRGLADLEAAKSSTARRIGGPPDFSALQDHLASKAGRSAEGAASLKAMGEGGWWTQSRLHDEMVAGVVDDKCRACLPASPEFGTFGEVRPQRGTFIHRAVQCQATKDLRSAYKDQQILREAELKGDPCSWFSTLALYQHGVPLRMARQPPPSMVVRSCGGREWPADFSFTGHAFTDGALRGRAPVEARRAGWACVLVDQEGKVVFGLYGPCPDAFPTALRAELRAVVMLLKHAVPPLTIHVDCKAVVDGWIRGREWTESSSRPDADLWRELWLRMEDVGPGISIVKCKGHATDNDVKKGDVTAQEKEANDNADFYAGCGATIAEEQRPNLALIEAYKDARRWYKWLSVLASDMPKDTQEVVVQKAEASEVQPGAAGAKRQLHQEKPHQLELEFDRWACSLCKYHISKYASKESIKAFRASPCPGDIAARAAANSAQGRQHVLFLSGEVTWCNVCGRYSEKRATALAHKACEGKPSRGGDGPLRRLRAGVHPKDASKALPKPIRIASYLDRQASKVCQTFRAR